MFRPPALPRTLDAALRDARDTRASVRGDALRDLAKHEAAARERIVSVLADALGDEAPEVRAAAATCLADIEAREAVDALVAAAGKGDGLGRQMTIAALGELGDPRGAGVARAALGDENPGIRFQAVIALPRLVDDVDEVTGALEAATRDADDQVVHIALRMAEEVAEAAGEFDARLVRRARALLNHDSTTVRVAAAVLLARAKEGAGREVLAAVACKAVTTRDGGDEAAAIELCGELGIEGARAGLEKRAFGGALGLFRDAFHWHARVALARMGHARAKTEIVRELGSGNRDRRVLAVAAAGRARLHEAKGALVALRQRGNDDDQHAVDEALALLEAETRARAGSRPDAPEAS